MRYLKMIINIKTYLCYFLFYLIIVFVLSGCSAEERCEYLVVEKEDSISVLYGTTVVDCSSFDISARIKFIEYNRSKNAVALVTEKGNLYYSFEGGKLQYIDDGMPGRNESGYLVKISDNGRVLTYFNKDGIHLYSEGTDEIIDTVGKEYYIRRLTLSPDGKTVGYSYMKNGDFDFCYVYCNGEKSKLLKGSIESVSDNGEVIYYGTVEKNYCINIIYNLDINTAEKIADGYSIDVSADCKDIIYNDVMGNTCIYRAFDNKTTKISHKDYWIVDDCADYENFNDFLLYNQNDLCRVIRSEDTYDIYEYVNLDMYTDEYILAADKRKIIYANAWKDSQKTASHETGWKTGRIEVSFPYTDYETVELHFIDTMYENSKPIMLADELRGLHEYGADRDIEHIYYINKSNELVYINGTSENKTVIDKNVGNFAVKPNGVCIYIRDLCGDSGVLCYSAAGSEGKEAEIDDRVSNLFVYGDAVAAMNGDRIYVSSEGMIFSVIE